MSINTELYNERLNLILNAVAFKKNSRVPVVILNDMLSSQHMGIKTAEFVGDPVLAAKVMLESLLDVGVDGVQLPIFNPKLLSLVWLSKLKLPGRELPENDLWQVQEKELMTVADYDVIIDKGWNYFYNDFCTNRLDNLFQQLAPIFEAFPKAYKDANEAGIVTLSGGFIMTPYEMVCGGRSMVKFMRDLYKIPDKVHAAFETAMVDLRANARQTLAAKPLGIWVGGWRAASEFLKPDIWERFEWPYLKELSQICIDEGVIPIHHLDSNWDRDVKYFKELPKQKSIFFPDGTTNIFKAKEVLGDHECINGDVSPTLLAIGTSEEVYEYSRKLINEIGPDGFILGQGCDIPPNAKVENVKAMVAAAYGR